MFFVNVNGSCVEKCSSKKAQSDFVRIDECLNEIISKGFGNKKNGKLKVSNDIIETISGLNEKIEQIREEAKKNIEKAVIESNLETLVSNQIKENEEKKDEEYNGIRKQDGKYLLHLRSQKTNKVISYLCLDFDEKTGSFIVQSAESTAKKRSEKKFKKSKNDFINAEKVIRAIKIDRVENAKKWLSETIQELGLAGQVGEPNEKAA